MQASIQDMADSRLHESNYVELHQIRCTFRYGVLTLNGMVSSYHARFVAQELVRKLQGIDIIDNQIAVNGVK